MEELQGKEVATPGTLTTATLLFTIFTEGIDHVDIPFDQIMDRVSSGEFDAGLLIHEGQITYRDEGFNKIIDFGELWRRMYNLPLPFSLGVDRKDLGGELARKLSHGLRQSIHYGYTHQHDAIPYALQYGWGISENLGARFIRMYVIELTIDMGESGRKALELLFRLGAERDVIPAIQNIELY